MSSVVNKWKMPRISPALFATIRHAVGDEQFLKTCAEIDFEPSPINAYHKGMTFVRSYLIEHNHAGSKDEIDCVLDYIWPFIETCLRHRSEQ